MLRSDTQLMWGNAQLIRIVAPPQTDCGDNWVEYILGEVVRPMLSQYGDKIRRVGILRYVKEYNHENPSKGVPKLSDRYREDNLCRWIWLRISTEDQELADIRERCIQLIEQSGCENPAGWQDYDLVHDLGKDHFTRPGSSPKEKVERAHLMAELLDATTRLMLDCLYRSDQGNWLFESNPGSTEEGHNVNPNNSTFEAAHHLFCNATAVPLSVDLFKHDQRGLLIALTPWMAGGLNLEDWTFIVRQFIGY
jgi:hypothetical protein